MALMLHHTTASSSSPLFTSYKSQSLGRKLATRISVVKSQQVSSSTEEESTNPSPQKPTNDSSQPGLGFGSSSPAAPPPPVNKKKKKQQDKGNRERASIIRREPLEKPSFATSQDVARAEDMTKNESAFLLAWLGLGAVILVEGIALAASGFLPESWDSFFVKYLYPSFTPTVFLFVAGTVAYGVLKYLQNENANSEN